MINLEKSWQILKISKNLTVLIYLDSLDENLDWKVLILKILTKKKKSCLDTKENLDSFQKYVSTRMKISISIALDCRDPQAYMIILLISWKMTLSMSWLFFWSPEKCDFRSFEIRPPEPRSFETQFYLFIFQVFNWEFWPRITWLVTLKKLFLHSGSARHQKWWLSSGINNLFIQQHNCRVKQYFLLF